MEGEREREKENKIIRKLRRKEETRRQRRDKEKKGVRENWKIIQVQGKKKKRATDGDKHTCTVDRVDISKNRDLPFKCGRCYYLRKNVLQLYIFISKELPMPISAKRKKEITKRKKERESESERRTKIENGFR